jgi:hypothetical protein
MLQKINWLGFGGAGIPTSLPRAIAELQGQTFSLLAGAGANTAIAVPGIEAYDTVQKALLFSGGAFSDITANVTVIDRRATGTLTIGTGVTIGDVVTVNGKSYSIAAAASITTNFAAGSVGIGIDNNSTATALAQAIMSGDSSLTCSVTNNVITVQNRVSGTVGNTVTLDVSQSNGHVTRSGATLAGGTATQGIKVSSDTTSGQIILIWWSKDLIPISTYSVVNQNLGS